MAFSRYLTVDTVSGFGDYTSVQAAINAAAAGVGGQAAASPTTRWVIQLNQGIWTEDINLTQGIILRGMSAFHSTIAGTIDIHPSAGIDTLGVNLQGNNRSYGVKVIADTNNLDVQINNLRLTVFRDQLDITRGIWLTGGATGGLFRIRNSDLYVANRYTGTNTGFAAKAAVIHLAADFVMACEVFHTHMKTSGSDTSTAWPIAALVEQYGGAGVYGYVHFGGCDWTVIHANNGHAPAPLKMYSNNAGWTGIIGLACWTVDGSDPETVFAYTGTPNTGVNPPGASPFVSKKYGELHAESVHSPSFALSFEGEEYPLEPIVTLDHTPTGADESPPGSLIVVNPA